MMNKRHVALITIGVAILAALFPIIVAIRLSDRQGIEAEKKRVLSYARDVLHRTDATADQIQAGFDLLAAVKADPCSDEALAVMRRIDLGSSYIQAVGVVSGDRLVCSSLGPHVDGLDLGPVDLMTSNGVSIRNDVRFPFAPDIPFLVIGRGEYAAIIHKGLPIDASTDEAGTSLASFMTDNGGIVASRGAIRPEWIARPAVDHETTFVDGGHVVAVVRSRKYLSGAVAAIPVGYLRDRVRSFAMILIPIGLAAGVILALAVSRLAKAQMAMPSAIKSALKRREFYLDYQPIVDLRSGEWVGAEALIRWKRPNGQFIRPDLFIPIAEDSGLIKDITRRVLELVAADAVDIFRSHPNFHIAINLSSADLNSPATVDLLGTLMTETSAGPHNIIVEATERGFMHGDMAKRIIHSLRERGIGVAIDDFGTGYSSLAYLEKFELDFLKIDKSFVDTIGTEAPTNHVVHHIVEMSKALKLEMIAEGVETEDQARYLRERGVQFAQGWLFAKPMRFADLAVRLAKDSETATA